MTAPGTSAPPHRLLRRVGRRGPHLSSGVGAPLDAISRTHCRRRPSTVSSQRSWAASPLGAWAAGRAADKRTHNARGVRGPRTVHRRDRHRVAGHPRLVRSLFGSRGRRRNGAGHPLRWSVSPASFLLIGVPAAAMGATYPIAVAWLARIESGDARSPQSITTAAGVLYAANSAEAAAGAMAAGFWLIELLGIRGTTWVAVALNVGAASLALWFGRAERLPARRPVSRADLKVGTTDGFHWPTWSSHSRPSKQAAGSDIQRATAHTRCLSQRRSQGFAARYTRSRGRG